MTLLCIRCNDRPAIDEWSCHCYECEQELDRIEMEEEDRLLAIERDLDDDTCDCQSCRGYPDGFRG